MTSSPIQRIFAFLQHHQDKTNEVLMAFAIPITTALVGTVTSFFIPVPTLTIVAATAETQNSARSTLSIDFQCTGTSSQECSTDFRKFVFPALSVLDCILYSRFDPKFVEPTPSFKDKLGRDFYEMKTIPRLKGGDLLRLTVLVDSKSIPYGKISFSDFSLKDLEGDNLLRSKFDCKYTSPDAREGACRQKSSLADRIKLLIPWGSADLKNITLSGTINLLQAVRS